MSYGHGFAVDYIADLHPYCVDIREHWPLVRLRDGRVLRLLREGATGFVWDDTTEEITFLAVGGHC